MPSNQLQLPLIAHIQELPVAWQAVLNHGHIKQLIENINAELNNLKNNNVVIFPSNPFKALSLIAPAQVKAIIIGQDPYHTPEMAQGLAFSVPNHCKCPPSLRNIFKELSRQYPNSLSSNSNDLTSWAQQGVLLINDIFTVEQGKAASHNHLGWQMVSDAIIQHIAGLAHAKVFMLWGAYAQKKAALIMQANNDKNLILKANHPSPFAATRPPIPFIGCGHFDLANQWLEQNNMPTINWLHR